MKTFFVIALQVLIVWCNVRVGEAAPTLSPPGSITISVPCATTTTINTMLKQEYGEQLGYSGFSRLGIMRFWKNEKTATFTVAVESRNISCVFVTGRYLMKEPEGTPL